MQFMSSTSVNCIEEMRWPMLMPMLLLLLRLLAKNFLAISNSNVEKRAERAGGQLAVRTEKTLCLTVWLIACHAHARTPTVAGSGREGGSYYDRCGDHSHRHASIQDAGHGTLLGWHSRHCILFSAHRNMQQPWQGVGQGQWGKGNLQ